jgi:putative transposase
VSAILPYRKRNGASAYNTAPPLTINKSDLAVADSDIPSIVLTYKYRLLPSKRQHAALEKILEDQRALYNCALEHRIGAWKKAAKRITLYSQMAELTELRKETHFNAIPANVQRWTLRRLDEAYQGFFRRVKGKGEQAGFPRFRGKGRWSSFGFAEFRGIRLKGRRLYFKGMPDSLRLNLHRILPDGKPLSCTFTRDHKGWYVCLQYRVPMKALPGTGKSIGVDVGLKELAVLSNGEAIPNPRVAQRAEREIRRRQRALARCKRGSKRRAKVRQQVTRCHAKVKNSRNTYLHQVSSRLVREHDLIAVENLNVKGLVRTRLAKSIKDASWAMLKEMLSYKAEWAGRQLVEVDPRNTSQACSGCGTIVPKNLSERWHSCPHCGLELDRDHNAAINVLHRAVLGPGLGNVGRWPERSAGNIALSARTNRVSTQVSEPNMEQARAYLGELLTALEDSVALNLRLLPVEEYKQSRDGDTLEADTVAATIKRQEDLLEALQRGRAR